MILATSLLYITVKPERMLNAERALDSVVISAIMEMFSPNKSVNLMDGATYAI